MLMFGGYTSAAARAAQQGCFTRDREPGIKGTQGAPALRRLWSRVVITSSPNSPKKGRSVTQDAPGRGSRGWARGRTRDEASAVVQGPSKSQGSRRGHLERSSGEDRAAKLSGY